MFNKAYILLFILCFSFLCSLLHCSILEANTLPAETPPYVIVTMPKGGTLLLSKLIFRVSKNPVRSLINESQTFPPHNYATIDKFVQVFPKIPNESIIAHLNYGKLLKQYTNIFSNFKRILMIRDPRDICVSTAFYVDLMPAVGQNFTFEDRLMLIIQSGPFFEHSLYNVKKEAQEALKWMKDPLTTICRFENLCGSQGGGTPEAQKIEVLKIANALNVQLNNDQLEKITENLWGATPTFRKGQIGSWKIHFTPEHKKAFKESMGDILIQMGYETNYEW